MLGNLDARTVSGMTKTKALYLLLSVLLTAFVVQPLKKAQAADETQTIRARVTRVESDRIQIKPLGGDTATMAGLWGSVVRVSPATTITTLDKRNRLKSIKTGSVVDIALTVTITGSSMTGDAIRIMQVRGACTKGNARLGGESAQAEIAMCRAAGFFGDELTVTIDTRNASISLSERMPGSSVQWQWGPNVPSTELRRINSMSYVATVLLPANTPLNTRFSVSWYGDGPDDGDPVKLYKLFKNKQLR